MTEHDAEKIKEQLTKVAEEDGTCREQRSFKLGAHGTVFVVCRLPPGHKLGLEGKPGETYPKHISKQEFGDGSSVTFTWD